MISLPIIPYIHHANVVLANPTHKPDHIHTQVRMPGMNAPCAPACMLVLGTHQACMAAELQQLQAGCEAQARQEALATAAQQWQRQLVGCVLEGQCSQQGQCRQQPSSGCGFDAPSGTDSHGAVHPQAPVHGCSSSKTARRFQAHHYHSQARAGAVALLHDVGVWLELKAAVVTTGSHGAPSLPGLQPTAEASALQGQQQHMQLSVSPSVSCQAGAPLLTSTVRSCVWSVCMYSVTRRVKNRRTSCRPAQSYL